MEPTFLALTVVCLLWGVVSMLAIASYCNQKGIKVNWILLRIFIFKYVNEYKRITVEENGKPGFWYYSMIISMNAAVALAILGLIFK